MFKIGNKVVGVNFPVFIIAEIGINHMGSEKLCKINFSSQKIWC